MLDQVPSAVNNAGDIVVEYPLVFDVGPPRGHEREDSSHGIPCPVWWGGWGSVDCILGNDMDMMAVEYSRGFQ